MRESHKIGDRRRRLHGAQPDRDRERRAGHDEDHDVAARGDRVDVAARRRHRDHEHHARVGDGADARDRHPHGDRRARLGRADAVPRREHRDERARRRWSASRSASAARSCSAHFTGWSTAVPVQAVALAVGFSAAVGVFFGYYPARKAAALDPIQRAALRMRLSSRGAAATRDLVDSTRIDVPRVTHYQIPRCRSG